MEKATFVGKLRAMMRIDIITVLPELLQSPLNYSILKRAQDKKLVEIVVHNLRDYSLDKHRRVDDYPFGGEAGMVMQIEPVDRAITQLKSERNYDEVIFTTPDGERFDQPMANRLSMAGNLIILCGHYKGIDYRIREHFVTKEVTIGDYVLTGGELAAAIMCDAIVRLIPGAIGDEQSALSDSFQDNLLAPPFIRARRNIKVGEFPMCCFRDINVKSTNGNTSSHSNVPDAYARIYWNDNSLLLSSISVNIVAREVCESMYVAGVIV